MPCRERERGGRNRQTDRQTDRETETETERQTKRERVFGEKIPLRY